jgi:hypothetical protein
VDNRIANVDRLLVGILGHRNSGKSHTWNTLFGRTVRTGIDVRRLTLRPGECVEVFLVSGSAEERHLYVGDILAGQGCRIVLCSMQYVAEVRQTLGYFADNGFSPLVHWLNPGYSDRHAIPDELGLVDEMLNTQGCTLAIRDGRRNADRRVQEMRQFIHGWALYRDLIIGTDV